MRRAIAPFLTGLVSIQAQTLLLREYIVLFGGSGLSIGIFMTAWFIWVGLGAALFNSSDRVRRVTTTHINELLLLWPVTIVLTMPVLRAIRQLTGVAAYEPVPPVALIGAALITTLLFSGMTGLLFPAAAARQGDKQQDSAIKAYWAEAVGAVIGGGLVTVMLYLSVNLITQIGIIILITAILTIIGRFYSQKHHFYTYFALFLTMVIGFSLVFAGSRIDRYFAKTRLYASTRGLYFVSRHETPYRVLTLARNSGQKVVLSNGNIALTKPFTSKDCGISAFVLAQTGARHVLALGLEGIRLAPLIKYRDTDLTVVFPDKMAWHVISAFFNGFSRNLHFIARDPRIFLARTKARFDAVVIAGGEPSLLAANRLYTVEAFRLVRGVLRKGGIVAVPARIPENFMGTIFRQYGGSILTTLRKVFAYTGIVPGAGGLFVAGNSPIVLTPDELIRKFKKRAGPDIKSFPPEAFYSLLKPERQAFLKKQYRISAPINTDNRPMAFYLKLLTLLKAGGGRASVRILDAFREHTLPVLLVVLFVGLLMLLIGRFRHDNKTPYGSTFAIMAVGAAGMGIFVLLLAAFQATLGTLFEDLGMAGAAFMSGLAIGALAMKRPSSIFGNAFRVLYTVIAGMIVAIMANIRFFDLTRPAFLGLFMVSGLITGGFWPVIAHTISLQTAARLETWDHIGAAFGALFFGVIVLPCMGVKGTGEAVGVLIVLAGVAMAMDGLRIRRFHGLRAWIAYTGPLPKTGIVLTALILIAIFTLPRLRPAPGLKTAISVKNLRNYETFSKAVKHETPFIHYELQGVDPGKNAYMVLSAAINPKIKGFAGPINLMLSIDKKGVIRKVRVIQSGETPAYVVNFPRFLKQFEGKSVDLDFILGRTPGIDAMTGATITSRAATRIVNTVDRSVATELLHHTPGHVRSRSIHIDSETWYVLLIFILGLLVHYFVGSWVRLAFLGLVVAVGGIVLNVSLSIPWLQGLFRLDLPPFTNLHLFLLTLLVLATTPLLGTIWCAHLCPFGALQELISRIGTRLHILKNPRARLEKTLRGMRYVILFMVVLSLYGSNPAKIGEIDPLSTVFSGHIFGMALFLAILVSMGALFNFRFFCRNICPVGAFLSAIGGISSVFGLGPARDFRHCDLGVNNHRDHDCIQCNRCARELNQAGAKPIPQGKILTDIVYIALILTAAFIFANRLATDSFQPSAHGIGRARQVNMQRLQQRIQSNTLSNHKAMFYKKQP